MGWKLCLAIWTALAAFIGAVLTGKGIAPPKSSVWLFVLGASVIFCLHYWWTLGFWRAQKLDNDISFFFRDLIMESVGVTFPAKLIDEIEHSRHRNRSVRSHWSCASQLGITALLAGGAVTAMVWASYQPSQETRHPSEGSLELNIGQNNLRYSIPEGKNVKITLGQDGKLDFQTSPSADNLTRP